MRVNTHYVAAKVIYGQSPRDASISHLIDDSMRANSLTVKAEGWITITT